MTHPIDIAVAPVADPRPTGPPMIVLKFGSSVLAETADIDRIVQEIYRWRRSGYRVVAVVSAIGDTTERLARLAPTPQTAAAQVATARLLATGEWQTAALVGLALDRFGVSYAILDEAQLGLRASGPALDATLEQIDLAVLREALETWGVVVVPGFIGRDAEDRPTLLGRGGSDLTALFIAARSRADRCRLIKDVDGLYPRDPQAVVDQPSPRRFERLTFDHALTLDESIVQHKAIRFAEAERREFEVAALASPHATRVGDVSADAPATSTFDAFVEWRRPDNRLKVALLGAGTVGLGVYRQLTGPFGDHFQIVSVAVKDRQKAVRQGVAADLLAPDAPAAIDSPCDVVIELVGGIAPPVHWIEAAMSRGKHVITANKMLLASELDRLQSLADRSGSTLRFSAAVGGALPVLETILALPDPSSVVAVQAILNGSSNFILDCVRRGDSLEQAIDRARGLGLTERDPRRDLDGLDAAEKLVLIGRTCGRPIGLDEIRRHRLTEERIASTRRGPGAGEAVIRQVARLDFSGAPPRGSVRYEALPPDHPLASVSGSENRIEMTLADGSRRIVKGLGAGRWPTTAAVLGDLLQLRIERSTADWSTRF